MDVDARDIRNAFERTIITLMGRVKVMEVCKAALRGVLRAKKALALPRVKEAVIGASVLLFMGSTAMPIALPEVISTFTKGTTKLANLGISCTNNSAFLSRIVGGFKPRTVPSTDD